MNFFTYFKQVVILALYLPFLSLSLNGQCGQADGIIIVNSTDDEGLGTLRDAINCANIDVGPNRIIFEIPNVDRAIIQVGLTSGTPLPSLVNGYTVIDATTQNGYGQNGIFEPKIILDGGIPNWTSPINALKIHGDGAEIYGLEIRNFPDDGIDVEGANDVIIGDEEKGNVIYNCGIDLDFFPDTGNDGPYNGVGIVASSDADNIQILNNILGTDYYRTPNLGNEWVGIYLRFGSDFALIEGNIIIGNEIGVRLRNVFAIKITENEIACNTEAGIELVDGANDDKTAPFISSATNSRIIGTGTSGEEIEVYIAEDCNSAPCQGSHFLGRTTVLNNGTWILNAPFTRDLIGIESVTALAIDNNNRTSTFSNCQIAEATTNCADNNGVIWVINTNDEGEGSLRAAIDCANDTPGPNTIQFNIEGGGRQQIAVAATTGEPLPFLRDAGTIIDATTQPGFGEMENYQPQIILDGSSHEWRFPHNALWVRADNCEIYGLEIRNFPDDGIDITGGDFNIIGAPYKGNVVYNCGAEKDIFEDDASQNEWNGCGIVLKNGVLNSVVQGNIIGTDYQQRETIGNELCGIIIQSDGRNNLIGGNQAGEGNIIAFNQIGVSILSGAYDNQILGNAFYCNENSGIDLSGNGNNQQAAPSINVASVSVLNGTGQNGETVEVYLTDNNCSTGPCQGKTLIGSTIITNNNWRLDAPFLNEVVLQGNEQITTLATSSSGSTSEFGACITVAEIEPPSNCSINLGISNFNNETCVGNDGTFTLSSNNAIPPITFGYENVSTQNPTFSNLIASAYNVTATDAGGCSATLNVIITKEPSPTLNIVSTSNENCRAADGEFTVLASGGQQPYIYELDNGFISRFPTFSNLEAGSYAVSVIDANNCIASQSISIQRTGNINVSIADMRADNCNTASGSFRLAASGGLAPYTYDLGNGASTVNEFTGLMAGNYSVTVADVNNCSTVANINLSGGTAPIASINNVTQTTCSQSTGSVSITVTGGQAPFQYDIGNGNSASSNFTNLAAGNYIITVTDANNCTTTQAININEPARPALNIISKSDAACGNANGTVSVLSSGGQAPYTYNIGSGITTNPNFNNLSEGNYEVTVYDANNCSDEIEIIISNSPIPTIDIANKQDASCNLNNAILTIQGTGAEPFTYDIGAGPSPNPTFSDLAPGIYNVTLTDNNNCSATTSIEILSTGGPQINVQNTAEARCDKANGSIIVNAFGGFPPYVYNIGNGSTDNPVFSNLAGGNYVVTLTDDNGCTTTQSVTLGNIPAPTFGIGNIIDANCGEANGSFNVSAFGGLPPYQFSIGGPNTDGSFFADLTAGTYTVVVTDANNCITALAVTVEGTEMPNVEVINIQKTDCGVSNGGFDLQVSGGNSPYFFDIGEGESTNSSFQNLSMGSYKVTITDASSCSQVKTIEVNGTTEISAQISNQLPAACGFANGSFKVSPSGGQSPYNFVLNNQNYSDSVFSNLIAGTYELETTDANGCFTINSIEITASDGPNVEIEVLTNCGDANALINVQASQGEPPYIFDIGNGPTTANTFRNIAEGIYQLRVLDSKGCETIEPIVVSISNQIPEASIEIISQPDCNENNGSIKIDVSKGRPPFLYSMTASDISPFSTFTNLSVGNYAITVIDAGGCTVTVPITLGGDEGNNPLADFNLDFDELTGNFSNLTENATSYSWDFGDGSTSSSENASHIYNNEGTYTICLTANNTCGSDTYCQDYIIEAININKNFEFDFGEIQGEIGEIIKVPVYVKNFREIVGFQKSVHLEDPTVAKIISIVDVNLKDLSAGLFNLKDDHFSVSWYDGNIEGFDLPDSTIIYQFEVELLLDNACTNVIIKENPLPIQVYRKVGSSEVEIEVFKRSGQVCIGEGGASTRTANIFGEILSEDGLMISEVTMSCTNAEDQVNSVNGAYLFENLPTPFDYQINPKKSINPLNGITTFDLVIIQNHILANEALNSPYKIIAADVNQSGTVTVTDILELRKLLLQDISEFTNNDSWQFIPSEFNFSNPENPLEENYPTSATISLSNKNVAANFIGIKIGDVNGTASPNSFVQSSSRNSQNGTFTIYTKNQYLKKGETAIITFTGANLANIIGFQYNLALNPEFISLEEIMYNELLRSNNFGKHLLQKGFLLTSWHAKPILDFPNNKLFSFRIKAKKAGYLSEFLAIKEEYLTAEAYQKDGTIINVRMDFISQKATSSPKFELQQNQPNPFTHSSVIKYQLPESGRVQLSIFDSQGRLIATIKENGKKGQNELEVKSVELNQNGIYFYRLNTPFGQAMKKMILIE